MTADADPRAKELYEFGPFLVDSEKELLLRGDETVPLTPKTFQVLLVLIRHKQEVVTKEMLLNEVWPDVFVEEANLSRNIFLLRKALGESPQDHQYIVTVPGRGYRFAEEVQLVREGELGIVAATHAKVQLEVKETRTRGWWAAGVAVVLAVAGMGMWWFWYRSPTLTAKDTIVLADFSNSTGDPIFDGTLREGLAIQLGQSPYLQIMDDLELQRNLRLMNLAAGTHITNPIAHDVCVRQGGAATIEGSIASLGKSYVITLEAITCKKGATLAREQEQADDKEQVLRALDKAATAIRSKLGESLATINQLDQPLEQATTPSLEALQNYTEGLDVMGTGQFRASIPFFERAIAIDPKFTMAYYVLGVVYENAGDLNKAAEYSRIAYRMIDRVSDPERVELTAYYYRFTGEWEKEIDAYQQAVRDGYPRPWSFHNQLAVTYNDLGKFEDGLREGLEANRLDADIEAPYRRVMDAYMCLGRLKEADQTAQAIRARGIGGARIHQRYLELAYLENDQPALDKEIQWFAGKPDEYISFGLQAAMRNVEDRRRASHELYRKAADQARHEELGYVADEFEEADARADALAGKCDTAKQLGRPALALAMCGETARAESLAAEMSKQFPNGTVWNAIQQPEIEASIALRGNDPARAVDLMAVASPYERAYPDAVYMRGMAYLGMHKGAEAAAEFQRIVDQQGTSWAATWVHPNWGQFYALSYLGMARGYMLADETPQARDAYKKFFALWKGADPDIPVLRQARAEYAKLP